MVPVSIGLDTEALFFPLEPRKEEFFKSLKKNYHNQFELENWTIRLKRNQNQKSASISVSARKNQSSFEWSNYQKVSFRNLDRFLHTVTMRDADL